MFLLLILLFLVLPTLAVRPSARSPLVIVVTTLEGDYPYGTSIRADGNWIAGRVPDEVGAKLKALYPSATINTVNTDDAERMHDKIDWWSLRQCDVVHKRRRSDCLLVVETKTPFTLRHSADVYDFRRWESSARHVLKHVLVAYKPLATRAPSHRLTPRPTLPYTCEARSLSECRGQCEYLGVEHGCRPKGKWCGFKTKLACEARPACEFRRSSCKFKLH